MFLLLKTPLTPLICKTAKPQHDGVQETIEYKTVILFVIKIKRINYMQPTKAQISLACWKIKYIIISRV